MKKYLLGLLLLSIILVSGVAGCPQKEAAAEVAGLQMSFVTDAPPISISLNREFPIYLDVINKGGDFINARDAKFYLTGVGSDIEGINGVQTNERSLPKKSMTPDRIVFAEKAKATFPIETTFYTLPLVVKSCYNYGTTAQVTLCMSARNDSTVCSTTGEKITSTSNIASPVQVTSLKEEIAGDKLRILMTLTNKLEGQVFLPGSDCDKLQSKEDLMDSFKQNKVNIEIRMPEKEKAGFSCHLLTQTDPYTPMDGLVGSANLGTVLCEKILSGKENYVMPFTVIVRYKYIDSISQSINIMP